MSDYLYIIQIVLAVLLIVSILFQQRGTGLGSAFGGGGGGETYHKRRGFEKVVFISSIVISVLFFISVFAGLFVFNF